MLSEFLEDFREEILASANEKTIRLASGRASSKDLQLGMSLFFQHVIDFLKDPNLLSSQKKISNGAAGHGKELLRLNYTLSHVVHTYGAMCQSITELAYQRKAKISSRDFNDLNLCLDIAIASAVSEYQYRSDQATHAREIRTLGFLVHELRNSLSSATVAHEMMKKGLVGVGGSTSKVLEENLDRMRKLIDRALSEVRLRTDPEIHVEEFSLNTLIDQILVTAENDAQQKKQTLLSDMREPLDIQTDRQLLLSALANLVQNAIKYSKEQSTISVTAKSVKDNITIKIADQCGGIKPSIVKSLFKPFVSGEDDKTGLGIGLNIVHRSVTMIGGKILLENKPGVGCVFVLQIPQSIPVVRKKMVSGKDSVHPRRRK